MIKFCLLLRANPDGGLTFVVDLVGEFPSSIARHPWNVFGQTFHNVLKCVEIVVENYYPIVGIRFAGNLTRSNGCYGW
jgi:hypothetical protein